MFLMMWHFTNEKINKNDFTRKKQNDPDYKINIGSKLKPHSNIPPSDSKMHEREREGGLALDADVMPPRSAENGDLLLHASSKRQPLPQWPPPSHRLHSLAGPSSSHFRLTHLRYYTFSSLQPS